MLAGTTAAADGRLGEALRPLGFSAAHVFSLLQTTNLRPCWLPPNGDTRKNIFKQKKPAAFRRNTKTGRRTNTAHRYKHDGLALVPRSGLGAARETRSVALAAFMPCALASQRSPAVTFVIWAVLRCQALYKVPTQPQALTHAPLTFLTESGCGAARTLMVCACGRPSVGQLQQSQDYKKKRSQTAWLWAGT